MSLPGSCIGRKRVPSPPTHISAVDIPAGTELRYGIIAPQKADGSIFTRDVAGGAEQFEILLQRVPDEWFRNPIFTDPSDPKYGSGANLQDWLNIN